MNATDPHKEQRARLPTDYTGGARAGGEMPDTLSPQVNGRLTWTKTETRTIRISGGPSEGELVPSRAQPSSVVKAASSKARASMSRR